MTEQLLGQEHRDTQTVRENYRLFLQEVLLENRQEELSNEMSLQMISQMEADLGE